MKKLFHRKKDSAPSSPEQTPPRSQRTDIAGAHPSFRASPYESTAPAHLPQTGQFPLKANSSSVSFQGQGRRSETYNRGHGTGATESSPRPSSSSPYYGSLPAPRVTSASYGNVNVGYPPTDGSTESGGAPNYQQRQGAAPSDSLTQNLSNLNFHSSKDPEDVPLPRHHGSNQFPANARETGYSSAAYERKPHGEDKLAGIRMVAAPEPTQPEEYVPRQTSDTVDRNRGGDEYYSRSYGHPNTKSSEYTLANGVDTEGIMQRKRSIPRKEVSNVPQTSGALADRTRHHAKSSSEPRYEHQDDHESRRQGNFRSQPVVHASSQKDAQAARPSAHEIVDRARGNTYDTEVDERIAPGKPALPLCSPLLTFIIQPWSMNEWIRIFTISERKLSRGKSTTMKFTTGSCPSSMLKCFHQGTSYQSKEADSSK